MGSFAPTAIYSSVSKSILTLLSAAVFGTFFTTADCVFTEIWNKS
jgi:hypothetical protein